MKFLTNAFSPSMVQVPALVLFEEVSKDEFCQSIKDAKSAIGHEGTAQVLTELCGFPVPYNRVQIKAKEGDELLIFLLTVRLEEGKVLGKEELLQLINEGKIKFVKASVMKYHVIDDLIRCEGVCDEKKYDYLVRQLKGEGNE